MPNQKFAKLVGRGLQVGAHDCFSKICIVRIIRKGLTVKTVSCKIASGKVVYMVN